MIWIVDIALCFVGKNCRGKESQNYKIDQSRTRYNSTQIAIFFYINYAIEFHHLGRLSIKLL